MAKEQAILTAKVGEAVEYNPGVRVKVTLRERTMLNGIGLMSHSDGRLLDNGLVRIDYPEDRPNDTYRYVLIPAHQCASIAVYR